MTSLAEKKEARACLKKKIRAVVFDFDGTLTNNCELMGAADGSIIKGRSHSDGQGISLLRDIGFHVAIATNEKDDQALAAKYLVEKWNNLPSAQPGAKNQWSLVHLFTGVGGMLKVHAAAIWLKSLGFQWDQCAAMGDDLVDVSLLAHAGFRAAPCTAEKVIKDRVHFISERPAGAGAVRDFANFVLQVREIDPTTLRTS